MFEQYLLTNADFRNVSENNKVTGFQVKLRIPYYRGVCLSQVQDVTLVVDGDLYPREKLRFSVGDHSYAFGEMTNVTDVYWGFGVFATLTARKPGGLAAGMHTVEARILIDTGGGNTPYSQRDRQERVTKTVNDPKALEELYKYSLSNVAIGKVTKKMTLVQ